MQKVKTKELSILIQEIWWCDMDSQCKNFGKFDAMDGGCDYCFRDNRKLFDICVQHTHSKENTVQLTINPYNDIIYIIPTNDKPLKIVVEGSDDRSN